jgi:hypothetical protein
VGTAGDSRTAYFLENSKQPEGRIDNGEEGTVLQGGKNAVPAVPAVPKAYLSGKTPDSISDDAVPTSGDAVPTPDEGAEERIRELVRQGMSEKHARAEVEVSQRQLDAAVAERGTEGE